MNRPLFHRLALAATLGLALGLAGCDVFDVDEVQDPNNPSLNDVIANPTPDKLANVAAGIESGSRIDISLYLINVGVVGREFYRFSGSDPRFVTELLGEGSQTLDNNTFYIARPWGARYRTIRNAYVLLEATDAPAVDAFYSEAEQAAVRGYARTWIAHQLLMNLNLTFDNGVRTDVADSENIGPIVDPYDAAIADIEAILDQAADDLSAAGDAALPFPTTIDNVGTVEFESAAGLLTFNRALAARIAAYRMDWDGVLDALGGSFIDVDGDLFLGAYHLFSTGAGDQTNLMHYPVDAPAGEIIVAHPSFVDDADEDDARVFGDDPKVAIHLDSEGEPTPVTVADLSSDYTFIRYESVSAPIPIIRNGELVLLRAEALAQTGDASGAVAAINVVRNAASLEDYDGGTSTGALIDEILRQRRYELYGEGHRWIDVRRYDRLGTLPIDRPEDDVWVQFPIPFAENAGG
jgi:hypothetical protein